MSADAVTGRVYFHSLSARCLARMASHPSLTLHPTPSPRSTIAGNSGGVARMSDPAMILGIKKTVTLPVMAKARIGHFVEAQVRGPSLPLAALISPPYSHRAGCILPMLTTSLAPLYQPAILTPPPLSLPLPFHAVLAPTGARGSGGGLH